MLYRVALALALLALGASVGRALARSRATVTAAPRRPRRLPANLLSAPMDNVSVH